jgi:hypothetical protein
MAVVVFGAIFGVAVILPAVAALTAKRTIRHSLRRCPCCASDGVRLAERRPLTLSSACISLQCGQCGAWRRMSVPPGAFRAQERRARRTRRRIAADAGRLARERRLEEFAAFARSLRSEIRSADDFLASTRPPRTIA